MMNRTELLCQFKKTTIADVTKSLPFIVIYHFIYACIPVYVRVYTAKTQIKAQMFHKRHLKS